MPNDLAVWPVDHRLPYKMAFVWPVVPCTNNLACSLLCVLKHKMTCGQWFGGFLQYVPPLCGQLFGLYLECTKLSCQAVCGLWPKTDPVWRFKCCLWCVLEFRDQCFVVGNDLCASLRSLWRAPLRRLQVALMHNRCQIYPAWQARPRQGQGQAWLNMHWSLPPPNTTQVQPGLARLLVPFGAFRCLWLSGQLHQAGGLRLPGWYM